jgi:hypothetical protein
VTPESLIFSKMFGQLLREDVVSVVRLGKSYQTGNAADWAMAILCRRFYISKDGSNHRASLV